MGFTEQEMLTMLLDKSGIHHIEKSKFTDIVRNRPYQAVKGKKTVFLDLKYWITFRMILGGETLSSNLSEDLIALYLNIYKKLQWLIETGKIVCVLSDSILSELEKMPLERRLETAKIMESLDANLVLNGLNAYTFEFINMDLMASGKLPLEDFHLSSVFEANRFLVAVELGRFKDEPDVLQNIMFDAMSNMTVTEYLTENDGERYDTSGKFAEMFNNGKSTNTTVSTYEQLLIAGIESQDESLRKILKYQPVNKINVADQLESYQWHAPFLYLHAAIHAAMTLEKARKIHSNDFFDLSHSCMGVGYADYFFTEKKFHHLLKSNPINCRNLYKSEIYSDPSEIIKTLEQL